MADALARGNRRGVGLGRATVLVAAALVAAFVARAALAESLLPRCAGALDGVVREGGCRCGFDRGGVLAGHAAGWRWECNLLRGPGPAALVPPAGLPAPGLPNGFTYAPAPPTQGGRGGMGY